jgi:tight adherence protein B
MILGLTLGALALVLLCGALLLWYWADQRARHLRTEHFVEDRIRTYDGPRGAEESGPPRSWDGGPKNWHGLLLRAGIAPTTGFYLKLAFLPVVLGLLALFRGGPVTGIALFVMLAAGSFFVVYLKADRRQRKMVSQVPDFLDMMVRLMTVGNSLGSAFEGAAAKIGDPLLEVVERASGLHKSGKELDIALRQVSRQYGLHELYLMAAVVGVAIRFGGRSDQVLERMALFIRDLEQARHELVALSAEVRMSAWMLALMPVGIACFILFFNNDMFMNMWYDPAGRKLLIGAFVLQAVGSFWLYRLARLNS